MVSSLAPKSSPLEDFPLPEHLLNPAWLGSGFHPFFCQLPGWHFSHRASFVSPTLSSPARAVCWVPLPGVELTFPCPWNIGSTSLSVSISANFCLAHCVCGLHLSAVPTFFFPFLCFGVCWWPHILWVWLPFGHFVIIVLTMSKVILPFQAPLSRNNLGILWSPRCFICTSPGTCCCPLYAVNSCASLSLSFGGFLTP